LDTSKFLIDSQVAYNLDTRVFRGLRLSNGLKTIPKIKKYKMYGIDTSHDKSHDFDLVSHFLTDIECRIFANYRQNILF
jgi:hypothetical protein